MRVRPLIDHKIFKADDASMMNVGLGVFLIECGPGSHGFLVCQEQELRCMIRRGGSKQGSTSHEIDQP